MHPAGPARNPPRRRARQRLRPSRLVGRRATVWRAILPLAAAAAGCRKQSTPGAAPPPPAVTVARPVEREVVEWDEYIGHIEAVETVDLRARVSGLIVTAAFQEGAIVNKGDCLVAIDVRPFQADLDAKLAIAAEAEARVALANIEFNRIKSIPRTARSATEYDAAEATLKQAEAVLAGARATAESARLNVEWCRVTAPITGRISRKYVTEGNLITGGTGAGTLLTTITSVDPIYCYIDADERSVLKYQRLAREGKRATARDQSVRVPCFLQLTDGSVYPEEGVIDFVDNRLDPTTGTILGRAVFPNTTGWLTPGFFARVRIPGSGSYRTLLVPDGAVTADQNQRLLLVVGADDLVERRPVRLGALFGEFRAIESGLAADDRVIINGLLQARPGIRVRPQATELSVGTLSLNSPDWPTTQELADDEPASTAPASPTTTRSAP